MSRHLVRPSSQLVLPGLSEASAHEGGEQPDRPSGSTPRPKRPSDQSVGLQLPPISSFDTADALTAAIAQLEPYLAELKRRRGNLIGAERSAKVRASKRPHPLELAAFFPDPRPGAMSNWGALDKAAAHFGVDRRTISRWRAGDLGKD